jgi:hypothetical protein
LVGFVHEKCIWVMQSLHESRQLIMVACNYNFATWRL